VPGEEHPVFGDVRYNAVFFMIGTAFMAASFALLVFTGLVPLVTGGQVAGLASEYALLVTIAAALGGTGFFALGLGAYVFSLNYDPIRQEAFLLFLSAAPYGIFLIAIHFAQIQLGGVNDFYAYAVERDASGAATIVVALPESYGALAPYRVLGAFAFAVASVGLAYFLSNMKVVRAVGGLTLRAVQVVGPLAFAAELMMFSGWSAFDGEHVGLDWLGAPFVLYFLGFLIHAVVVPVLGVVVAVRTGSIFWDAAKTVRYLSDFRKKAAAVAASRKRREKDDRPWWEQIAEQGEEKP
jgi:hypothetical protein